MLPFCTGYLLQIEGFAPVPAECVVEVIHLPRTRALTDRSSPAYPIPSCHAVITDDRGAVLLVQRQREPYRGYWGLPGGKVEWGETVVGALAREVREETGLIIGTPRLITYRDAINRAADGDPTFHFVMFYFVAPVAGGSLRAGDDAAAVRWIAETELETLPLVPELRDILAAATA